MVAGSSINVLDHAHNIFVVDGRGEYSRILSTPSCQLLLAGNKLLECDRSAPFATAVDGGSALHRGCKTTGSVPFTGSSEP